MGNKITRISRRTFKNKKKSRHNGEQNTCNEPEARNSIFMATATIPTCMKCVYGCREEIETNRLNGKGSFYSGHFGCIEKSTLPTCGAQFDAKKFDKIFQLNEKPTTQFDESENDDSQFEEEQSEEQSAPMQDDDNHSFSSIFEVFKKFEHDALLNSTALDEMFFYPAIKDAAECVGSYYIKFDEPNQSRKPKPVQRHFSVNKSSTFTSTSTSTSINNEKLFDKTKQLDDSLLDEAHLYDTVASSDEFDIIIRKGSQKTLMNPQQLKSFKPDDLKIHFKKFDVKNFVATKHTPIPFNAAQFDTRQIDDIKFDGILFNDSQFNAKYFDATQRDIRPFFDTQLEKSKINVSKLDSTPQLNKIRPFKESQFDSSQFDIKPKLKSFSCTRFDHEQFDGIENQRDITEFEAALIRTAQFVASHFGTDYSKDTHYGVKDFIAPPFRRTQFNASQFDAKQFDVSQFSLAQFDATQFDVSNFDATQFTAAQFDAQAFENLHGNRFGSSRFGNSPKLHDSFFNVTQFDAKLFNAIHLDTQRVCAA